ncbi:MAG: hypothetical protein M3308_01945, partial [Actinomycetota bacterium]|nr:hypothetical protein [Actinomycetota bacterium]
RHRDRPGWGRRYPVHFGATEPPTPMSGPSTAHVRELAEQVEPPWHGPAARRVVAFAHRLTAGHSPTFAQVVALLRQNDQTAVDARTVLTQPLNGPGGPSLDDVVLDLVLGDRFAELKPALSRLAIARDLSDASITPILQTEPESAAHQLLEFRDTDMWTSSALLGPPTLHPLARRAIAHRLARPGGIGNVVWAFAHNQLRLAAIELDDLTTARYHQLALGQVADVAHELSIEFDPANPGEWFAQLVAIAEAPLAHPQTGMDSVDHFAKLTGSDDYSELVTTTTRLVAALQLHTDPLGDPTHQLCQIVAEELRRLAHHAAGGMVFLLGRADEYVACGNRWHGGGN